MTAHDHSTVVRGCYRCDLGRDEAMAIRQEIRTEVRALREMATDFRHISMTTAAELCDEKARAIESELDL